MTTTNENSEAVAAENFYNTGARYKGLFGWIFTTDHKRIGILYLVSMRSSSPG